MQTTTDLLQRFQSLEVGRITFTKDTMGTAVLLEGRLPVKVKAGCDRIHTVSSESFLLIKHCFSNFSLVFLFLAFSLLASSWKTSMWKKKFPCLLAST